MCKWGGCGVVGTHKQLVSYGVELLSLVEAQAGSNPASHPNIGGMMAKGTTKTRFNKYMFRRTIFGKQVLQVSWYCQDFDTKTDKNIGKPYLQAWDASTLETAKAETLLDKTCFMEAPC